MSASHAPLDRSELLRQRLLRRMARPQRHRLLHGYPMAPLMRAVPDGYDPFASFEPDSFRPLIIGVLPHTFCNPKVKGCGFCTFPHETFARAPLQRVLNAVAIEIEETARRQPSLCERRVEAVYFGGGTANLMAPGDLEKQGAILASMFDISASELTLEGVPKYFLARNQALLDVLAHLGVRHRRISMGIQTFDSLWLQRMGREAFGARDDFAHVVAAAQRRGFTTSADLLYNLPGASPAHAVADVCAAIDIGLDQVCVYNLVLTPELGTEWAHVDSLVRAMPNSMQALNTWLAVRDTLLANGYLQTTLTNFERKDAIETSRRFSYETSSFDPGTYDGLGFGPGAISTFTSRNRQRAAKWMSVGTSSAFADSIERTGRAVGSVFKYSPTDLRLLHLTRNIAGLAINCHNYKSFFQTDLFADFPFYFDTLVTAGLVLCNEERVELTPEGMFYADAIAGFLAEDRLGHLRGGAQDHAALRHHMG
jgi:oxygen-independent coproporphyrinogen-3 oxidase